MPELARWKHAALGYEIEQRRVERARGVGRGRSPERLMMRGSRACACALALSLLMAGCTHVAPYQRGRLAHPTMTQATESAAAGHLHAVQEGAAGGGSVAESGCGCN